MTSRHSRHRAARTMIAVTTMVLLPATAVGAQELVLQNEHVRRVLTFDGQVWRTTQFARADGSRALRVRSDEFLALLFDDREVTLDQYRAAGQPKRDTVAGVQRVTIRYVRRAPITNAPAAVTIHYLLGRDPYLRKEVRLELSAGDSVDRLEVERFTTERPATRGGRGEPVLIDGNWFFGIEYPASYTRHTDGNTPAAWSGPYDRLGNYSFIDLANRDVERQPRAGLVRLMHFPGYAKQQPDGEWMSASKTAVAGVRGSQPTTELAFLDYLDRIRRPVRSFLHYNNWYDRAGKRLSIANFVDSTFLTFKRQLAPFGVQLDAMVPDDGWQDRRSIYQPNPQQFPNGMADLEALGTALRGAGTQMGLWIALNGYNSDIDWGVANGYVEADRNAHFRRFKRYYSVTHPKYNAAIREQLTQLITRGGVQYLKHDFNEMADTGAGRGHPATDRHGHEASVDATIELLALERRLNPHIYQNVTNWIWFSPWWLQHANNLWMLASDAGEFRDRPELSLLVMAAAYRDVHLRRAWGDAATRPLVPISHLMTHGIIYTDSKYAQSAEPLRDFADHVMMYYMRGVQLKEWYITPRLLSKEQWEVLGRATRWSQEHVRTLANAVLVGGDPARGEPYGYMAWNGDRGILAVRNPGPGEAELVAPFDASTWYRGRTGREFRARVVYPYQNDWPARIRSGDSIRVTVPGHSVVVFHLSPGRATGGHHAAVVAPVFTRIRQDSQWVVRGRMPNEAMQRAELLVISRDSQPTLLYLNGVAHQSTRTNRGRGWQMAAFDLRDVRGRDVELRLHASGERVEAWLILDRPVRSLPASADPRLPAPVAQGYRRQTLRVGGRGGD